MGTYNFFGPDNEQMHNDFDVNPYCDWGNTEDIGGSSFLWEVSKAAKNIVVYNSSKSAQSHFLRIKKEIYPELFEVPDTEKLPNLELNSL